MAYDLERSDSDMPGGGLGVRMRVVGLNWTTALVGWEVCWFFLYSDKFGISGSSSFQAMFAGHIYNVTSCVITVYT